MIWCAFQKPRRVTATGLRLVGLVLVACLCAGCSDDAVSSADRVEAPTAIPAPAGVGADGARLTLEVIDGGEATGRVITDHRGFAVYGTTGETTDDLVCVEGCLDVWPPVEPRDAAIAAALDEALYETFVRPDGIEQVAYAGVPLYTWTGDSEIGITGGAGVAGTWFALTETGGFIG